MKARQALIVMLTLAANARAATPSLIFSPTQVIFPPQAVGAGGSSKNVTISLSQTGTLTVTSTTASSGFAVPNSCAGNLPSGFQCPIPVSFAPTGAGPIQGTVSVSFVSSAAATQSTPVCGTGLPGTGDFTVGFVFSCFANTATGPSVFNLAVFPNSFNGTVTLSCVTSPSPAPCSVSPSSVTLSDTTPVNITVTAGSTTAGVRSPHPAPRHALGAMGLAAMVLLCALGRGSRRRAAVGLALLMMVAAVFTGCGATSTNSKVIQVNTVTITATGNSITHQSLLRLSPQ